MSSNFIYYVYAYLRSKDSKTAKAGTPYYIGKGKGNRIKTRHSCPVPNDEKLIVLLEQNLSNIGALALERRLIRWYGRKDLGTGILLNRTDGGDGSENLIPSKESNLKRSATLKGRVLSEETREKQRQSWKTRAPASAETRAKWSERNRRRVWTAESRAKAGNSSRGKHWWNNQIEQCLSQEQPGPTWVAGKLRFR